MIFNMQSGGVVPDRTIDAQTITPGTADKEIKAGTYLRGKTTIKGDADLIAANIKKGVEIFGVTGDFPAIGLADMGFTKFSIDSFSFSTSQSWRDVVIPHSLGENPKLVYIYTETEATTQYDIEKFIGVVKPYSDNNVIEGVYFYLNTSDSTLRVVKEAHLIPQDGYITSTFGSLDHKFITGATYKIITFA